MDPLLSALVRLGSRVRDRIRRGMAEPDGGWARPAEQGVGDLQYGIDVLGEQELVAAAQELFAAAGPLRLLSEGLRAEGEVINPGDGGRLLVVDPIDGTRGLMHDKRSAFFLAGLAPDGSEPRLRALTHAVLIEIPGTRSHLSDVCAVGTEGRVESWTEHLEIGERRELVLRPSTATDLDHGFGTVSRFFGGAGEQMGRFHDALLARLMPDAPDAWMGVFEDQYICNGGQMHALMTGRDRFVADLRPLFRRTDGGRLLCSHPYDVLSTPIAEAAGVVVTDARGAPLDVPLDLHTDVAWVAYGSQALQERIEPALHAALQDVGLG